MISKRVINVNKPYHQQVPSIHYHGYIEQEQPKVFIFRDFRLSKLYRSVQLVSTQKYMTNHHTPNPRIRVAS
jgi:hypothetical protein